jgi:hypothetical protein
MPFSYTNGQRCRIRGMGSYANIYFGPYVRCVYRNETRTTLYWACTNPDCLYHRERTRYVQSPATKFCPQCGAAVLNVPTTVPSRPDRYALIGDAFTEIASEQQDTKLYLGSNMGGDDVPRDFHCDDQESHLDVTKLDWLSEVRWFEGRYAAELEALRGAYDDVVVSWGLHCYVR